MSLQDLRQSYDAPPLDPATLAGDPFDQFNAWFADAQSAGLREPNAMTLATADTAGTPSGRTVLLKGVDDANTPKRGFVFYTNYASSKASDLAANPKAALNFHWDDHPRAVRTVRIAGTVTKVSEQETAAYFQSRPRGSQIGAWVSHQSAVIASRKVLEDRQRELEAQHPGDAPLPVPPFWGGYRVTPTAFEFWQGQASRLHDRFRYTGGNDDWQIERLAP